MKRKKKQAHKNSRPAFIIIDGKLQKYYPADMSYDDIEEAVQEIKKRLFQSRKDQTG